MVRDSGLTTDTWMDDMWKYESCDYPSVLTMLTGIATFWGIVSIWFFIMWLMHIGHNGSEFLWLDSVFLDRNHMCTPYHYEQSFYVCLTDLLNYFFLSQTSQVLGSMVCFMFPKGFFIFQCFGAYSTYECFIFILIWHQIFKNSILPFHDEVTRRMWENF